MMPWLILQLSPSCWTTLLMKYVCLTKIKIQFLQVDFGPCVLTSWMFVCKVVNGATYVNIDMIESKKDGTRMLLVEGARKHPSCMGDLACFHELIAEVPFKNILDVLLLHSCYINSMLLY